MNNTSVTQSQLTRLINGESVMIREATVIPEGHELIEIHALKSGSSIFEHRQKDSDMCSSIIRPPHRVGDTVKLLEEWRFYECAEDCLWVNYSNGVSVCMFDIFPLVQPGLASGWPEHIYPFIEDKRGNLKREWQPAHTMPPEFSRYSVEVVKVDCKQLKDASFGEMGFVYEGMNHRDTQFNVLEETRNEFQERVWDDQHPDTPYDPDLWTFGTEFKLIKEEEINYHG